MKSTKATFLSALKNFDVPLDFAEKLWELAHAEGVVEGSMKTKLIAMRIFGKPPVLAPKSFTEQA